MDSAIVTAIIVGGLSVLGTFISAKYTSNVKVAKLEVKVDTLERETRKHNGVLERTYKLEEKVGILQHDVSALKK